MSYASFCKDPLKYREYFYTEKSVSHDLNLYSEPYFYEHNLGF